MYGAMGNFITIAKKKAAIGVAAAILAFGPTVEADEIGFNHALSLYDKPIMTSVVTPTNKKKPKRSLKISLDNPIAGYDQNSNAWFSATQLLGKASDEVGITLGLDEYIVGRVAQHLTFQFYLTEGLTYYTHEIAHNYHAIKQGQSRLSFSPAKFTNEGFPAVKRNGSYYRGHKKLSREELITDYAVGINQTQYNTARLWDLTGDVITFDQALAFISNKRDLAKYIKNGFDTSSTTNPVGEGDIINYLNFLKAKGIRIHKSGLQKRSMFADFASIPTLESYAAMIRFLVLGEREQEKIEIKLGDVHVQPPVIAHYLTTNGEFFNCTGKIRLPQDAMVWYSVGFDLDTFGGGKVNTLRAGAKVKTLEIGPVGINPFFHTTMQRDPIKPKGIHVGLETRINEGPFSLGGTIGLSRNDIIENNIKGRREGILATADIAVSF